MKKISVLISVAVVSLAVLAVRDTAADSSQSVNGDYQRAVGIATAALSDCITAARQAGNTILDSGVPGANEGDWSIAFCGRQTPTQSPAQHIGGVRIENWEVVEVNCEFPSPTSNPCPVF